MNVGLPVFTSFPLCASCPFEDTRRFFTKPEKDMRPRIRMAVSYVSKKKGLGRHCFSSNLITPWSARSQQGPNRHWKVLGENRCFFWEIPREGGRWNSALCPLRGVATVMQGLYSLCYFPREMNLKHPHKGNLPSKLPLLCLYSGPCSLGNPKIYLLMEGPCKTSQLGQW